METEFEKHVGDPLAKSEDPAGMSDVFKKLLTAGIGAAFMTEESIRQYVKDIKLPKEVLNLILRNANKSKDEIISRVTDEVLHIINKIDFVSEASKFVEEHKFKINAEVEIIKKNPNAKLTPTIKIKTK